METLNLIGSICSMLSLLVAVILTSNVISIKKSIKDNSSNKVDINKNTVKKGDIAGRDIKNKFEKP